jgi:hypothetical protein
MAKARRYFFNSCSRKPDGRYTTFHPEILGYGGLRPRACRSDSTKVLLRSLSGFKGSPSRTLPPAVADTALGLAVREGSASLGPLGAGTDQTLDE